MDLKDKDEVKEITREVLKERKLSLVEDCFKDPIRARNMGYALAFLIFVMLAFIVYAGIQQIEMSFDIQDLARENVELVEQNEILRKNFNSLSESNTEKRDMIYELIEKMPCDGLKDLLLDIKYDSYDWNIQKYTIAKCG